jgi:hypothetical protein
MAKNFQLIEVPEDMSAPADRDAYDDEEWFYFGSNGKLVTNNTKYYKGVYYTFDENGVMEDDWFKESLLSVATSATSSITAYAADSGALGSGWIYTEKYDDAGTSKWYYLVTIDVTTSDGTKTKRSVPFNSFEDPEATADQYYAAKSISSKTYLFDTTGYMITGVKTLTKDTVSKWCGVTAKELKAGTYYFKSDSGSTQGQMQTGKTTVTDDGETYYYYFDSKLGGKAITNTIKDTIVYGADGNRIQADDGNTNQIMTAKDDIYWYKSANTDADCKGNIAINKGDQFIVSSTGKLKVSTSVKIDDVTYKTDENGVIKK